MGDTARLSDPPFSNLFQRELPSEGKNHALRSIKQRVTAIRADHPDNLLARYFDPDYFRSLDDNARIRLLKVIASGLEHPESRMGVYVSDGRDYDDFAPLLDPMIRTYHGFRSNRILCQHHDWAVLPSKFRLADIDPFLVGASVRIRLARNISTFPMPAAMSASQRHDLEQIVVHAIKSLQDDSQFGGHYYSLTPGSADAMDAAACHHRISAHQIFRDMREDRYLAATNIATDWPVGRGAYISSDEDFLIWVGEEDHLRLMVMGTGRNLSHWMARLKHGHERLAELIPPFVHTERLGYITSCPTNLGTAMRASLHLPLPNLTGNGQDLHLAAKAASDFGLSVRGVDGEGSESGMGGVLDISPIARLGLTEAAIIERLYDGTKALWFLENTMI